MSDCPNGLCYPNMQKCKDAIFWEKMEDFVV